MAVSHFLFLCDREGHVVTTLKLLIAIVISGLTVAYISPLVYAAADLLTSINRMVESLR